MKDTIVRCAPTTPALTKLTLVFSLGSRLMGGGQDYHIGPQRCQEAGQHEEAEEALRPRGRESHPAALGRALTSLFVEADLLSPSQFCMVCKDGGDVYQCASCPRSCHGPCSGVSRLFQERPPRYPCSLSRARSRADPIVLQFTEAELGAMM